jgi:uncharacterized protein YfaS (alpha-2-macroglobulin family)
VVIGLRFNQPVAPEQIAKHTSLQYWPHEWEPPPPPDDAAARPDGADPEAQAAFEAKVKKVKAEAGRRGIVRYRNASEWDVETFRPGDDLVVLETSDVPAPDTWLRVRIGPQALGVQGTQAHGQPQETRLELEPTFFVDGLRCSRACDPDSYNPVRLRGSVAAAAARKALRVLDVTDPKSPAPLPQAGSPDSGEDTLYDQEYDHGSALALEDAGFSLQAARRYALVVDKSLTAEDGQVLGYTWGGTLENWHRRSFTSFGSGHGVWERGGGRQLPFYARNLRSARYWLAPVSPLELMPLIRRLQAAWFSAFPDGAGTLLSLRLQPDRIESRALDLEGVLGFAGTGLVWAGLEDGETIPRAHPTADRNRRATLVQVTNLGVSVKDSPLNTLVFVTRLDTGEPVPDARVAIRTLDNALMWSGTTDAAGVAIAPDTDLRDPEDYWQLRFLVTAEKDGDVAYVASDWHDGVEPWTFGLSYDLEQAKPLLRGSVFADRGVYRLGEEVRFKAILRSDTARGMTLLPAGTSAEIVLLSSQAEELDKRVVTLGEWSSADWTYRLPADGALGHYEVRAAVAGQTQPISGRFLVAAYRRPDFRVDATLTGPSSLAGTALEAAVSGRYLFGAPMAGQGVSWAVTRTPLRSLPPTVSDRFPEKDWVLRDEEWTNGAAEPVKRGEGTLDAEGGLSVSLEPERSLGRPFQFTFEATVTDVSRQQISGRASFRVDPAPWYVGLRRLPYFAQVKDGVATEVVAVGLGGGAVDGVDVELSLTQVQWHSVRRAEGQGFYTWETERRERPAGSWKVTTALTPVQLALPLEAGGYFVLKAVARDAEGRSTTTATSFYAVGPGYTAWARYDHNRIDLVPERTNYRPGDTARILVKSPWEKATALLTTEREGVRTHKVFTLSSTQETVEVPIRDEDVPNVYVSVLLVKGRSGDYAPEDASDPGKPSFRLGYVELGVEDKAKRLDLAVSADREEYRPGAKAAISVAVSDPARQPAQAEVTLWAVDYGVLSLTGFRTPDVVPSVWIAKALQVSNEDSRQRIISRRAIVPKGGDEGGGGGADQGPGTPVRKDFRVLAFWLGSVVTDAAGKATAEVVLPESLTTYRIMAVAGDKASRFGWGEREIRIAKPVLLKPAFPRFLALGDRALFGSVVHSQLARKGPAVVTLKSLDPGVLAVTGPARQTVQMAPKSQNEVRFEVEARALGSARLQMSVRLQGEADAFEETLPVRVLAAPETVAAYGQAKPEAHETLELPAGVVPGFGGLRLELSSTALVGLAEGARYLVEYPYGCAEQRASAALALMLSADLGEAFALPGIEPARLTEVVRTTLDELSSFQCEDGGFGYWSGDCRSQPYLTSFLLHVLQRAQTLGHPVSPGALEKGYAALERALAEPAPFHEGWWPAYTSWQAFAVRVLARGGRNVDSQLTRLHGYLDRMPIYAIAYLYDAMTATGETGPRREELMRRLRNAILPEGGSAHVEERSDPQLAWHWSSNVRTTAIVLGAFTRGAAEEASIPGLVRWLMQARRQGRWGNTQENAHALEALVDYYKTFETQAPDFAATVALATETVLREEFRGRSSAPKTRELPMDDLVGRAPAGQRLDLAFARDGAGTLHYLARLRYAADPADQQALDQGFSIERSYAAQTASEGAAGGLRYKAGDLVRVTLNLRVPKERRFVAVTDPLPAGFEPVESWFATTAADLARDQRREEARGGNFWEEGGFDHVERHDDRVLLFATRLAEGEHAFSYVVRATTAGTFRAAPAHAEQMYEPEVCGRSASVVVEVEP